MSGAQPKAGSIAGCVTVCAEVNPKITKIRNDQGWVNEIIENPDELVIRVREAQAAKEVVSIAYLGNIVEVWEEFDKGDLHIDLGSDQTSLHNPWAGGYYPAGMSFEESNEMMASNPEMFKEKVQESLRRHADAINRHTAKGTYFFDYGNAFLLEASRAGADVMAENGIDFKYPSYVQDIMGPMCFDYGFGPFRWVCASGNPDDLLKTDEIACDVLEEIMKGSPSEIQQQMADNIQWIKGAQENKLVVKDLITKCEHLKQKNRAHKFELRKNCTDLANYLERFSNHVGVSLWDPESTDDIPFKEDLERRQENAE